MSGGGAGAEGARSGGSTTDGALTDDWCAHHFDHLSPELSATLDGTMARMRAEHPVAWSDQRGGFWIVSRYADVLRVAQDAATFSSASGVAVPYAPPVIPAVPEMMDPPEHRLYKRLLDPFFTPRAVREHADRTRATIDELLDGFVERGTCEFMAEFARPFPGRVFFESVLHAPAEEAPELIRLALLGSTHTHPDSRDARARIGEWVAGLFARRDGVASRGDVVDAILAAEIGGAPIADVNAIGMVLLLLFGGLGTTAGALGQAMVRFCRDPGIPDLLRRQPELVDAAVEELLRLDTPFAFIARTATRDVELGGREIRAGDKVVISWASANRDEREFPDPDRFVIDRPHNRHISFGAGVHRCAGSNLARVNLRLAVAALVDRLHDLRLAPGAEPIRFHANLTRSPEEVPIEFAPGPPAAGA